MYPRASLPASETTTDSIAAGFSTFCDHCVEGTRAAAFLCCDRYAHGAAGYPCSTRTVQNGFCYYGHRLLSRDLLHATVGLTYVAR
jgi:hypothetical protein